MKKIFVCSSLSLVLFFILIDSVQCLRKKPMKMEAFNYLLIFQNPLTFILPGESQRAISFYVLETIYGV